MTKTYRTTRIPWTAHTWNQVRGCTPVSPGCAYCYAKQIARRFGDGDFSVHTFPDRLLEPARWTAPRTVFAGSMTDLFHVEIPPEFLAQIFEVMNRESRHTWQILTKRPLQALLNTTRRIVTWGPNLWLGVTCEDQETTISRVWCLKRIAVSHRFVSHEPLLEQIYNPELIWAANTQAKSDIEWVIVGGESGPRARPCHEAWVRSLYVQAGSAGVPFFFKARGNNWVPDDGPKIDWESVREMPAGVNL